MIVSSPQPLLPIWLVLPAAVIVILVLWAHLWFLSRADMPSSRRRIRTANGYLMLLLTPLIAFAFGIATTRDPRTFAIAWTLIVWLLGLVVLVACLDMLNSARLTRLSHRRLRREMARILSGQVSDSPAAAAHVPSRAVD